MLQSIENGLSLPEDLSIAFVVKRNYLTLFFNEQQSSFSFFQKAMSSIINYLLLLNIKKLTLYVYNDCFKMREIVFTKHFAELLCCKRFKIEFSCFSSNRKKRQIETYYFESLSKKTNNNFILDIYQNYQAKEFALVYLRKVANDIYKNQTEILSIDKLILEKDIVIGAYDILIFLGENSRIGTGCMIESAYSELFFINENLSLFRAKYMEDIIHQYKKRNRRYGARY